MKRLLLATTAVIGLAAAAQAADLPYRAAPPVYAPPAFTWTGFYVGVNAGYGFGTNDRNDRGFGNDSVFFPAGNAAFLPGSGYTTSDPLIPNATPFAVIPVPGGPAFAAPATVLNLNSFSGNGCGGFGGFSTHDCDRNRSGFVGGGQIGYNWQLTPGAGFVIGVEADIQFADLNHRRHDGFFNGFNNNTFTIGGGGGNVFPGAPLFTNPVVISTTFGGFPVGNPDGTATVGIYTFPVVFPVAPGQAIANAINPTALGPVTFFNPLVRHENNGVDWFGTLRGRLGYGFDRVLIYATGGLAFGGGSRDDDFNTVGFGFGGTACGAFSHDCDDNRTRVGFAVGGGLEYAFTNNLSLKIEGLYVNLGDRDRNHDGFFAAGGSLPYARDASGRTYFAPTTAFTGNGFFDRRNRDTDFAVIRAGINYKFGWEAPPAPVVARY